MFWMYFWVFAKEWGGGRNHHFEMKKKINKYCISVDRSQEWKCKECDVPNKSILPKETSKAKSEETQREAAEIAAQISFKVRTCSVPGTIE